MLDRQDIRKSAFVGHSPAAFRLRDDGPLAGLSFAVKDLIDIEGSPTACGNPDRLRDDGLAPSTAPAVLTLLGAGATCVGKTHTDEVACGMFGTNPHFGTPINPKAPDRVPGGSSSGSASAVAAGLCDFALGTDTGGSVRVPASFCGIFGIRTTHGRISTAGVMAMAPSFDTVGWLAASAETLARVGETYFGPIPDRGRRAPADRNRRVRRGGAQDRRRRFSPPFARSAAPRTSGSTRKASTTGSTRSGRFNCTISAARSDNGRACRAARSARASATA